MPKFAANLTMLFNEAARSSTASRRRAEAGFEAVEYLFPYPYPMQRAGRPPAATTA